MVKNFNSLDVVVDNIISDGTFYKIGNQIICSSEVAYAFCFMGGVDDNSIKHAGEIAKKVVYEKIDSIIAKAYT